MQPHSQFTHCAEHFNLQFKQSPELSLLTWIESDPNEALERLKDN